MRQRDHRCFRPCGLLLYCCLMLRPNAQGLPPADPPDDDCASPRARSVIALDANAASVDLLTIREAAALLRISQSTIRNAVHSGQLRAFRFGTRRGTIRIAASDLDDYAAACATGTPNRRSRPAAARTNGSIFKCLDAKRLLAAWRQQDALGGPPDGCSAPSCGSSYAPSVPPRS